MSEEQPPDVAPVSQELQSKSQWHCTLQRVNQIAFLVFQYNLLRCLTPTFLAPKKDKIDEPGEGSA